VGQPVIKNGSTWIAQHQHAVDLIQKRAQEIFLHFKKLSAHTAIESSCFTHRFFISADFVTSCKSIRSVSAEGQKHLREMTKEKMISVNR